MGLGNVQIIFDNPKAVFSPGKPITGRVLILASSSVKIRSVVFTFNGKATVSRIENKSERNANGKTENIRVQYHAEEQYFKNKTNLEGKIGTLQLTVGEHAYPFNFSLPHQLPSTFTSDHGSVQYEAKVKIDGPRSNDNTTRRSFEVMSKINLNDDSSLKKPQKKEIENFFAVVFLSLDQCQWKCTFRRYSGFVPGQIIPITIEIDNNSNVDIDSVNVRLKKTLKFQVKYPSVSTKSFPSVLAALALPGVEKMFSKTNTYEMKVPKSLTFSDLKYCGIISEDYELSVVAHCGGMHKKTEVNLDLTMGHIPLSVAQDGPEFGDSVQSLDQNNRSNEQFLANSAQPIGFINSTPVPGLARQVPLLNSQSQLPYPSNPEVNPYYNT